MFVKCINLCEEFTTKSSSDFAKICWLLYLNPGYFRWSWKCFTLLALLPIHSHDLLTWHVYKRNGFIVCLCITENTVCIVERRNLSFMVLMYFKRWHQNKRKYRLYDNINWWYKWSQLSSSLFLYSRVVFLFFFLHEYEQAKFPICGQPCPDFGQPLICCLRVRETLKELGML